MAEYIDREKVYKAIPAEEDNLTGSGMTLDEMDAYNDGIDAMYYLVMNAPKADVVEKSKIDKAIEEIRKLSPKPTVEDVLVGNPEKDEIWAVLVEVLNIIEKNLGDEK